MTAAVDRQAATAAAAPAVPPWRPLLDGELAERARDAVLAVAEALCRPEVVGSIHRPGLSRGHASRALFLTYAAAGLGEPRWLEAAADALAAAGEALASEPVGVELFGGFTGVGWTFQHLAGRLFPAAEAADASDEIDDALCGVLDGRWAGPYDLIAGLAGFVLHALEGPPRRASDRLLELALAELDRHAEADGGGRTWRTRPELLPAHQRAESPRGHYNLGVAHGVPGVVAAAAAAVSRGAGGEPARRLLDDAAAWLLGREQGPEAEARFANWIDAAAGGGPEPSPATQPTRLAWCYGDLGIAAVLDLAGRAAQRADWRHTARRLARSAAARPAERSGIRDAGLCHGAAGVAHLFNRLAQSTGDAVLADAARRAYAEALDLRQPGRGIGGFLAWEPSRGGWQADPGFLTGAAGVGLGLLAGVSAVEPEWDRALAVSATGPTATGPSAAVPAAAGSPADGDPGRAA